MSDGNEPNAALAGNLRDWLIWTTGVNLRAAPADEVIEMGSVPAGAAPALRQSEQVAAAGTGSPADAPLDEAAPATAAPIRAAISAMPGAFPEDDDADEDPRAPTAAMLANLSQRLQADRNRPRDPVVAAELYNRLRRLGLAHGADSRATSNADLMSRISPEDDAAWWRCQGWSDAERAAFHKASFMAGLLNPAATFLSNTLNYIVAPAIGYAAGTSWASFGFGAGIALITPLMDAGQRSGFIELCEQIQERYGPSVSNKKATINHKEWPPELARTAQAAAGRYADAGGALTAGIDRLLPLLPGEDGAPLRDGPAIARAVADASPEERMELVGLLADFQAAETELAEIHAKVCMTEAVNANQEVDNNWQMVTRTIRSPVSTLVGLARGLSREEMAEAAAAGLETAKERVERLSAGQAVGVQAALALTIYGANMVAAGMGIMNKYEQKNRLNLMFGDYLTEAGAAKSATGQPIDPEDIDQEKLGSFIQGDAQARVKRLGAILDTKIKDAEKAVAAIEARSQLQPEAAAEEGSAISGEAQIEIDLLRQKIADMAAERDILKSGNLEDLPHDGVAVALLKGNTESLFSRYLIEGLLKKYKKKGELSSQTAQRIGQTFHMLIFGSAASALVSKLGSAILGGAEKSAAGQIAGLAVGGLAMGGIGAYFQGTAVNIKNNRRDNAGTDQEVGLGTQIGRGMLGARYAVEHAIAMHSANAEMAKALNDMSTASELAKLLGQGLAEAPAAAA